MLIAEVTAAVVITFTLMYYIFYSISKNTEKQMADIDLKLKYALFYTLACVWILAEMSVFPVQLGSKFTLHELLLYLTIPLSVILSVLLIYELKSLVFWTTLIYSTIILATDFFGYATHQQVKNFYIPMAIMLAITCLAGIFVFFNIPERWCEQIRIF